MQKIMIVIECVYEIYNCSWLTPQNFNAVGISFDFLSIEHLNLYVGYRYIYTGMYIQVNIYRHIYIYRYVG